MDSKKVPSASSSVAGPSQANPGFFCSKKLQIKKQDVFLYLFSLISRQPLVHRNNSKSVYLSVCLSSLRSWQTAEQILIILQGRFITILVKGNSTLPREIAPGKKITKTTILPPSALEALVFYITIYFSPSLIIFCMMTLYNRSISRQPNQKAVRFWESVQEQPAAGCSTCQAAATLSLPSKSASCLVRWQQPGSGMIKLLLFY